MIARKIQSHEPFCVVELDLTRSTRVGGHLRVTVEGERNVRFPTLILTRPSVLEIQDVLCRWAEV